MAYVMFCGRRAAVTHDPGSNVLLDDQNPVPDLILAHIVRESEIPL